MKLALQKSLGCGGGKKLPSEEISRELHHAQGKKILSFLLILIVLLLQGEHSLTLSSLPSIFSKMSKTWKGHTADQNLQETQSIPLSFHFKVIQSTCTLVLEFKCAYVDVCMFLCCCLCVCNFNIYICIDIDNITFRK